MRAIYPDNNNGDDRADPEATPGLRPAPEAGTDAGSFTLEVDGQLFDVRPNALGGTDYTWLTGPDPGYGFGVSPAPDLSVDEHRATIRGFLAMVDPATGHIEDDDRTR